MRHTLACLLLLSLPACSGKEAPQSCTGAGVKVDGAFDGAAFASCRFDDEGRLQLKIAPENEPINHSPWYAFRLTSNRATTLRIVLDYGDYEHRYQPDTSLDGRSWEALSDDAVYQDDDKTRASFALPLAPDGPLTVASQPLLTSDDYAEWINELVQQGEVEAEKIGVSVEGRPIWRLSTEARPATLLVLGRQHPPETTGAEAMMFFLKRVLADDSLAQQFRAQVGLLIYPLLNPDGVDKGHWRHNVGGKDLNRDWGVFSQPETSMVANDIKQMLALRDTQLIKSLDFHSTWYEVFYTQPDGAVKVEPALLPTWLRDFAVAMQGREANFEINRQSANNSRPTAKSYFFEQYGIASTTFEIGDKTSREDIDTYATTAAETFMRAWLSTR